LLYACRCFGWVCYCSWVISDANLYMCWPLDRCQYCLFSQSMKMSEITTWEQECQQSKHLHITIVQVVT
jgi:hypothetical protein